MADEQILARQVTLDEFCNYMGKLEYIKGRIVTGPGIELFVGVKEFHESIRALEARTIPIPEIVKQLVALIGRKLTAYVGGVRDVRAVDRWMNTISGNRVLVLSPASSL